LCNDLRQKGHADEIYQRTGLVLDAYFSASKLAWLLDRVQSEQMDPPLELENVLAGTVDAWILWNLTGRKIHATDDSNASRTMLLNLESRQWDAKLLDLFGIPAHFMPEIRPSLGDFGHTDADIIGAEIPIMSVLGDQQAALYAHGCNRPGLLKCTYGTGAFLVSHTGSEIARSQHNLLSTVAWTDVATNGKSEVGYALEGSMFTAGACVQWLRDGVQMVTSAADTEDMARTVPDNNGVYFVPALSGLGAPHWDMNARGTFIGITGGVKREHMVRSVLEAIAYEVCEVVQAVNDDSGTPVKLLKVDGGASQNNFLLQFQADALGIPVERPAVLDATAQGAAFAAGLASGFWDSYDDLIRDRKIDRVFEPGDGSAQAQEQYHLWLKAVERAKNWAE
jgi:glycerol kinase